MKQWFESTLQYEKDFGDGKLKKVKEVFLVDAINFGEAEARIIKEGRNLISGDFEVSSVKKEGINEMFKNEEGGTWFKLKVNFIILDEVSGKEKQTKTVMYVQCLDIKDVMGKLTEGMKGTMSDWIVTSIAETKVLDVFEYDLSEEK